MFHLQLRQFPHVARAFNLTRDELDERFATPWASGAPIEHEDRRWSPERARLTIYEGPELRPDEIGMGRGWATVGKTSREVTETVLAQAHRGPQSRPTVEAFKEQVAQAATTPLTFGAVVELAVAEYPLWRASERLALAEQAVWELLHQGHLAISGADGPIEPDCWQPVVISWSTWTSDGPDAPTLETRAPR
jgi:hypothetical protein